MATKKKGKQGRTWPVAVGALVLGLVAALLSGLYLKSREAAIRAALEGEEEREVTVVVAARNLPRGSVVSEANFAVRRIPEKFVHEDAVLPGDFENYQGRSIIAAVGAGKTLLKTFMDDTFPVDFSDTIPKGRRAMTVTVDEVNSVAGFMRPGNHIDLFVNIPFNVSGFDPAMLAPDLVSLVPASLTQMIPEDVLAQAADLPPELVSRVTPSNVIMPVLQNVRVLAAGRSPYRESLDLLRQPQQMRERTFTNVTLDVLPREAALLASALDKGELLALLRNRGDDGAADFTAVSARDLFDHASGMAAAERERAARATVAGGLDGAGNLVDAAGKRIMSRAELEKAGFRVDDQGRIIDRDGNVVKAEDLVVSADGTVMTRQQLAAAGLEVNEHGQLIDRNGNVVAASDLVKGSDGKLYNRRQLEAAGLAVNARGEIVDGDGRVVDASDLVTGSDGRVYSKRKLAAAGLKVDDQGRVVDAVTGAVVDPREMVTLNDGTVMTREQMAAAGLRVDASGNIVDARTGEVLTSAQVQQRAKLAAAGLTVNADGQIVDTRTGEVLSGAEAEKRLKMATAGLKVDENGNVVDVATGRVVSQDEVAARLADSGRQMAAAGLKVNERGQVVDTATGRVLSASEVAERLAAVADVKAPGDARTVKIIVGGASKDGVAKVEDLPVGE